MASERVSRGRWEFEDWHHPACAQSYCEKNFCREHRRVFWVCQDHYVERAVGWFGGDGECVRCKHDYEMGQLERCMGLPKAS